MTEKMHKSGPEDPVPKEKAVPKKKGKKKADGSMPLTGHLKEMRNRLLVCVIVFVLGCLIFLSQAERLVTLLTDMGERYGYIYVFIAPQELLMQYFKVSVLASVCVTLPLIFYEVWAFVRPGLTKREMLTTAFAMVFGLACFVVGVLFAYYITLPFMLNFLIGLNTTETIRASISVESYIDFLLTVFIIFGCVFEMPLLSIILSRLGILTPKLMRKGRAYAIVIIFVVAAIITPPDVFSQVMVALPMIVLYEVSILLSAIVHRFVRKKKAAEGELDDEEEEEEEQED